jgi:hypothetical protein
MIFIALMKTYLFIDPSAVLLSAVAKENQIKFVERDSPSKSLRQNMILCRMKPKLFIDLCARAVLLSANKLPKRNQILNFKGTVLRLRNDLY